MTTINQNTQSIMALSDDLLIVDQVLIDANIGIDELITLSRSSVESTYNQIEKTNSQILILDISISKSFSIDLLKKIANQNIELIIISGNLDDVIKVIPYRPISFLLKPVEETLLNDALNKV